MSVRSKVDVCDWGDPKQLLELLSDIVNVREYADEAVSPELVELLLEAFRHGPSLANTQPAEIIRVSEAALRERVAKATLDAFKRPESFGGQEWVREAPELFVVVTELRRAEARLGPDGRAAATQYAFASIQNLRVMAGFLKLGSACITEFEPERLSAVVGLPWYVHPVAIITAGYPKGSVERPARLSAGEIVHQDRWCDRCAVPDGVAGGESENVDGGAKVENPGVNQLPLRRSVRSFRGEQIPAELLQVALADACRAPSSGNMQPWEFVVVDDPTLKEKLVATTYTGHEKNTASPQKWMLSAPVIVAVCANLERTRARYGPDGDEWAPLDSAAAAENFLLSVAGLGLGSCWVGGFDAGRAARVLGLPACVRIIGLFPVGYPDEKQDEKQPECQSEDQPENPGDGREAVPMPWLKPRISVRLVTHHNRFNDPYWVSKP